MLEGKDLVTNIISFPKLCDDYERREKFKSGS